MALSLTIEVPSSDSRALRAALWIAQQVWRATKTYGVAHTAIAGGAEAGRAVTTNHESADCGPWTQHAIRSVLRSACHERDASEADVLKSALAAISDNPALGKTALGNSSELLIKVDAAAALGTVPDSFCVRRMLAPRYSEYWESCGKDRSTSPNGLRYEYIGGEATP